MLSNHFEIVHRTFYMIGVLKEQQTSKICEKFSLELFLDRLLS